MISNRLKSIASFINKKDKVIDIGTDHGLLAIFLYQNKLCTSIAASDINKNALKSAQANIAANNLIEQIPTILSDGFENIDPKKFNTAVIAGMGRTTISKIIEHENANNIKKIIIQTNNEHSQMREYMSKKGYYLCEERVLKERNKFYILMNYIKSKEKNTKTEIKFGLYNETYIEYFTNIMIQNSKILEKVPAKKIFLRSSIKKQNKELNKIIKSILTKN